MAVSLLLIHLNLSDNIVFIERYSYSIAPRMINLSHRTAGFHKTHLLVGSQEVLQTTVDIRSPNKMVLWRLNPCESLRRDG